MLAAECRAVIEVGKGGKKKRGATTAAGATAGRGTSADKALENGSRLCDR